MTDSLCINRSDLEVGFFAPRYKRYLEIAGNDDVLALEIYLWNVGLAQVMLRMLADSRQNAENCPLCSCFDSILRSNASVHDDNALSIVDA